MEGACSTHGRGENCMKTSIGKMKSPLGRPRHRWKDNIRMDLKGIY
jgi:hypothetical protein